MTYSRLALISALVTMTGSPACTTQPATAAAAVSQSAPAAPNPPTVATDNTATGTVAESMTGGGYTYIRLQTSKGDIWIATTERPVTTGQRVTALLEMPMENFHSKTLDRDFPLIYFVAEIVREGEQLRGPVQGPAAGMPMGAHGTTPAAAAPQGPVERMSPAPGGLSIADVWKQRAALANRTVVTRGRVVKVNNGIMGRNWIHLQDGSGSAADGTNDLIVTTEATLAIGDVVTMSGVLAVAKDFGSGYAYEAILEQATVNGR